MNNHDAHEPVTDAQRARELADQGAAARRDGRDQEAYDLFAESLALFRRAGDRVNELRRLIDIAYLCGWADFRDGLDMFTRRRRLAEEAIPLAREIGDKSLLARALCAFSGCIIGQTATQMLEEAMALATSSGDQGTLADAMICLANNLKFKGDRRRARSLQNRALTLCRKLGDKSGEARLLFSMANSARKPTQRAYLERALELRRELGQKKRLVEILLWLQHLYGPDEQVQREAVNREGLDLCIQLKNAIWAAMCLNNLAEIARARGDEHEAMALESESRRIYEPPEPDPEADAAFKAVLKSRDMQAAIGALQRVLPA